MDQIGAPQGGDELEKLNSRGDDGQCANSNELLPAKQVAEGKQDEDDSGPPIEWARLALICFEGLPLPIGAPGAPEAAAAAATALEAMRRICYLVPLGSN